MGATSSLLRDQCGLIKSLLGRGTGALCPGGGWEAVALAGELASCFPCALLRGRIGEVLGQVSHCPPPCPFQTFWGACVTDSIIEMDGMSLR